MVVGAGVPDVPIPDVLGMDQDQATDQLESAGFEVATETRSVDEEDEDGTVVDVEPSDASAPKGSTVTITIGELDRPASTTTTTTASTTTTTEG
jgi:serine/threonine-protein kinase